MLNDFINCPAFVDINPIQDGLFRCCSRIGEAKRVSGQFPDGDFPDQTLPQRTLPG